MTKLTLIDDSHVILLNRAVVVAKIKGAASGLEELEKVKDSPALAMYHLFHANCAEFYIELNDLVNAATGIDNAIKFAGLPVEKDLLRNRRDQLKKKSDSNVPLIGS